MKQINSIKQSWHIGLLLLMLLALIGPWAHDAVNVPAEYPCEVRLYGDFCGIPLSGVQIFSMMVSGLAGIGMRLMTGTEFTQTLRKFLFVLSYLLLLLPILSDLLLVLRGERQRWQLLHVAAKSLALCLVAGFILLGLPVLSIPPWASWGIWLYIGLMLFALVFESLNLFQDKTLT